MVIIQVKDMINIVNCIRKCEQLTKDNLPELQKMMDCYPYFQAPRLLYLYLLHQFEESNFDESLRNSSIYITDRRALFSLIQNNLLGKTTIPDNNFHSSQDNNQEISKEEEKEQRSSVKSNSRSFTLIDDFLLEYSDKKGEGKNNHLSKQVGQEAASDYTSYLLNMEDKDDAKLKPDTDEKMSDSVPVPTRPIPKKESESVDEVPAVIEPNEGISDKYFTETLAKIYVKQGKYSKALEIIQRLYLRDPNKNIYFADQIRYLEKLLINNRNQKNK